MKLNTRLPNHCDSTALAFSLLGKRSSQNVNLYIICCLFLLDKFVKLISLILTNQFKTSGRYYEKVQVKVNDFLPLDYISEDIF